MRATISDRRRAHAEREQDGLETKQGGEVARLARQDAVPRRRLQPHPDAGDHGARNGSSRRAGHSARCETMGGGRDAHDGWHPAALHYPLARRPQVVDDTGACLPSTALQLASPGSAQFLREWHQVDQEASAPRGLEAGRHGPLFGWGSRRHRGRQTPVAVDRFQPARAQVLEAKARAAAA